MGARESNAGDEFHLLWAVRRLLLMLQPDAALRRVVVEGVSPVDLASRSPSLLSGVDMAEYFGGEGFEQAKLVAVSQLKYSWRQPQRTWTAARLAAPGPRGQAGVITRLAEAFEAMLKEHDREVVLAKLRLRLVSNQPSHPNLRKLVADVMDILAARPGPLNLATLSDSLSSGQQADLQRLYTASNLKKRAFTDFLRLLDVGDLGTSGRWQQEAEIVATLGEHLLDDPGAAARDLIDLVRRQALPEQSDSLGLNREDLLARLNAAGIDAIFPMPSRIAEPERVFTTPDLTSLANALLDGDGGWLVAHGDAGVGKTTTISALKNRLPSGSTVVVYDCFGGGEYLSPAETRHLPQPALLQMINEIAVRCGTPMLVKPPDLMARLWRRLEEVLAIAGKGAIAIGARFVLAIDAIDNAVVASRERSENSFVGDLLRLRLPPGVSIVLSCRSHRLEDIGVPTDVEQVELRGFDLAASSESLRSRFPEAEEEECREFHRQSNGNPRTQFYLLSPERAEAISTVGQAVAGAHLTPESYFEDLLAAAVGHVPDAARALAHLADLVHLTRPVKLETFAGASGLSTSQARSFCRGLVPSVQLTEDAIEFRDEDFETFLRDQVSAAAASAAHSRLAEYFYAHRDDDPEAAVALAEHLRAAGRDDDLIALTVDEGHPGTINDPVARIQTYFRRLELSMQVAERAEQRPFALRLAVLAARAARTDQAVATVVKRRPDLAMRFGDRQAVARIYEATYREPWRGPMHMRVAALYAQLGERDAAESQLRMAEAWIRRWSTLEKNERYDWELGADDVAAAAQAVFWLEGPEAAMAWVRRWRPLTFVMEVGAQLAAALARVQSPRRVANQIARLELPALVEARLLAELFANGYRAPKTQVRRIAEALVDSPPREQRRREPWTVMFVELAGAVTGDAALILALLRIYGPPIPDQSPLGVSLGDWDEPLRLHCLRAAAEDREPEFEVLLPAELREGSPEPEDHREIERRRTRRKRFDVIKRFQPGYARRAHALLRNPSIAPTAHEIRTELEAYRSATTHVWYRPDHTYASWARVAAETLADCRGDGSQLLTEIAEAAPAVTTGDGTHIWLGLGGILVNRRRYRELALVLLDKVVSATEEAEEPAEERARRILDVAGLVTPHDSELAADYYRRAVVAAEGLDDEGAELLSVNARLGTLCAAQADPRHIALAERTARAVEGFRPFVSEAGSLPMTRTAAAVTALAPPAGLALMSRWEDEDRLSIEHSAPGVLAQAVQGGFLSPEQGLALLHLGGESSFAERTAVEMLEAIQAKGAPARSRMVRATGRLSTFVGRDLLPDARLSAAPPLGKWLEERGLGDAPGAPELLALASFAEQLGEDPGHYLSNSEDHTEKLAALERRTRNDGVAKMPTRLGEFVELWASGEWIERYLVGVGSRIAPGKRVAALRALAELPADGELWRSHSEALLRALKHWLQEWRNSKPVTEWVDEELEQMLEARVRWLFSYPEIADRTLPLLMEMPGLADPAAVLLRTLGPRLAQLRAFQLFALARGLAIPMTPSQQTDALEWSLALLEDGEPAEPPTLPGVPSEAIAGLLWALFAHPDKQMRWRAAHAARQMLADGDPELGKALVERLRSEEGGPYVSPDLEFFWISAQQWTSMLLARVADQAPESLAGQCADLAQLALDSEWPHAAIREFARRAALRLDRHGNSGLDVETREKLHSANRPVACLSERGTHWETRGGRDAGENRRYQFDGLDVIPYWYEPLGKVFALPTRKIAERAEHWIVDRLLFSQQEVDAARRERGERYEHDELSRHQGSQPRVESLSSYLEYHAMLLAAGELVAAGQPVSVDSWEDYEEPWMTWLADHLDAASERWSIDLRGPSPLAPPSYGRLGPVSEWRERVSADYDEALGLNHGNDGIVVDAYTEVHGENRYGYVYVSSALVSPESACALQRALQSCDPRDFRLPKEGDSAFASDLLIDQPGFRLLPWIAERRIEVAGIEEHDPLRRIGLSFSRPGQAFVADRNLRVADGGRRMLDSNGETVVWTELWSDERTPLRYERRISYSAGARVFVKLPELLGFLSTQEMDLIIEVRLARQYAERELKDKHPYEPGKNRIYLLRRDGTLEAMGGASQFG